MILRSPNATITFACFSLIETEKRKELQGILAGLWSMRLNTSATAVLFEIMHLAMVENSSKRLNNTDWGSRHEQK